MGLDAVELIIATEEAFEIEIRDEEAMVLYTPQDLIKLVATKLAQRYTQSQSFCLTQRIFYALRRQAVGPGKLLSRRLFRPSLDWHQDLPKAAHATLWQSLSRSGSGQLTLPKLVRPKWLERILYLVSLSGEVSILWLLHSYGGLSLHPVGWIVLSLFILVLLLSIGLHLTRSYQCEIPLAYRQVYQLVEFLVATCPQSFKSDHHWSYEQIRITVKHLVMGQLGVKVYDETWRFVEDFGID